MTAPAEKTRSGLLLQTCFEVLRDHGPMNGRSVITEIARRVSLTPYELARVSSGTPRWDVDVRFQTGNSGSVGWLVKQDSLWRLTDAGLAALERYTSPDQLLAEQNRRYAEILRSRRAARKTLGNQLDRIAAALDVVPAGSWTSHDDIAEIIDSTPEMVAHLLAADGDSLPTVHRVLTAAGEVPPPHQLPAGLRRGDPRTKLVAEGVEFVGAQASQEQRVPAEVLRAALVDEPAGRRAWLVRGSNVEGLDLVPQWLAEGFVSLSAGQLPVVDPDIPDPELRRVVEEAYRHKTYSVRERLVAEFAAFLRLMRPNDIVITTQGGRFFLGAVDGPAVFVDSPDKRSNLRRPVHWLTPSNPFDLVELPPPLPTLVQSQDEVVDLTNALSAVDKLLAQIDSGAAAAPVPPAEATLAAITPAFADTMMTDQRWLEDVVALLSQRRQIILYGPPGTGKTYLATRLAEHLTDPSAVSLVQFHPSYTYEDFFEGFRPEPTGDGSLRFRLRPGPFRKLADAAREHPNTAYILVIDEINRGNLAKIFGELYFLLEYRDQRISLQYSQEGDFTLPRNLYVIGTMNTADRSIALVDAAMRRRFAFVEMHPTKPPVDGMLREWLHRRGLPPDAADLLDALNSRLEDQDYAIGPSYLMRDEIYRDPNGLERVWRHDILPLLVEHHYADRIDVHERYGLDSLRASLSSIP